MIKRLIFVMTMAMVIALGSAATTSAASSVVTAASTASAAHQHSLSGDDRRPPRPVVNRPSVQGGGCGSFATYCIWLNKEEQKVVGTAGVAWVAAWLCGAGPVTCAAAAAIAAVLIRYIEKHGICWHPFFGRLKVRVLPTVLIVGCVP